MTYLPDAKVWVALAVDAHPHHAQAKAWFKGIGKNSLAFCRITEMGLLRLLTNSHVMSGEALSAQGAWAVRQQFETHGRVRYLEEAEGFAAIWRGTSGAGKVGPNYWTDAYLGSFCASSGATLVTFDRGFGQRLKHRANCKVLLLDGD